MKRILFVDDSSLVLKAMQRLLYSLRDEWRTEFCLSGEAALAKLAEAPYDVLISDLQMSPMNGVELLRECRRLYPATVRIVLSGVTEQSEIIRIADVAHQFLSKPCNAETLKATVARSSALHQRMANQTLGRLVNSLTALPSLPTIYNELMDELRSEDCSIECVAELISEDVAMTTNLLKFVNSSFFGLPRRIETPRQAATMLGLDLVKSLVLSAGVFSQFDSSRIQGFSLEQFVDHSLSVSSLAQRIARDCGLDKSQSSNALMAGVLHDVGLLILAANLPDEFGEALARAEQDEKPLWEVEVDCLGVSHADVSAYLLDLWNFPAEIVEAVAFHQVPSQFPGVEAGPLLAVHVANALTEVCSIRPDPLDRDYLERVGVLEKLSSWQERTTVQPA